MRLALAAFITLLHQSSAFAPTPFTKSTPSRSNTFKQSAFVDPSIFADAHQHVDTLSNFFSSIMVSDGDLSDSINALTDAATSAVADAAPAAAPAVVEAAAVAAPDATQAAADAANDNGWFGFLEGPIQFILEGIHGALSAVGVSSNSWGVSILLMTTLIKLLTYPLTFSQLESTGKMQVRLLLLC